MKQNYLIKNLFIITLVLSVIASCATGEKFSSIKEGMSKSEVTNLLGSHDQVSKKEGGWSIYYYKDRLLSGWSWDKTDYYVVFSPIGRVYEYGHGSVDTRTSERMAQWSQEQQRINSTTLPKTVDCVSNVYGSTVNTACTSH